MIHFVGAGCGAPDLITVRGMHLLEKADVIIYAGSLVNPKLLDYAKADCQVYNSAVMTLEEVLAVMVEAEQEGKDVVRLHTGEPSIYGAVQEQMQELDARKLAYDSTPGVSACFGAAAAMNLEYTLPDISQSLIITRMEGRTAVPEKESIEAFAAHQCSMAIYLSTGMWPEEEIYICTVETLAQTAAEHGITKTALVLVGDVINKSGYSKSRLYAEDFSTEFRAAKKS